MQSHMSCADILNYYHFQVKLTPEELAAIIEQTGGALKVIITISELPNVTVILLLDH